MTFRRLVLISAARTPIGRAHQTVSRPGVSTACHVG
jgi:hypothetical protein